MLFQIMNKFPLLFVISLIFAVPSFAQFEKIIHQSFETYEIENLEINVNGEYEVESWAGNVILTETKVQLYDASPSIFNFYLEKERYNLTSNQTDANVTITSVDMVRKPIRTKKGECYEFVKIRVFIPEDYVKVGEHKWRFDTGEELPPVAVKGNDDSGN